MQVVIAYRLPFFRTIVGDVCQQFAAGITVAPSNQVSPNIQAGGIPYFILVGTRFPDARHDDGACARAACRAPSDAALLDGHGESVAAYPSAAVAVCGVMALACLPSVFHVP